MLRLVREDKRLADSEKLAASELALQVHSLNIGRAGNYNNSNKGERKLLTKEERRREIEELKNAQSMLTAKKWDIGYANAQN